MIQKPNQPAATTVGRLTSAACRLMAAIAATATLAACQTQLTDPLDNIQPASHTRTLTVQMPTNQQPNTRVAYDDLDLDLTWQEGDELEVMNPTTFATSTFTLVSGAGTANATFSGVEPDSPDNTTYFVTHQAANFAHPVPDEEMAIVTDAITQQQTGNDNTDHLRQHLYLELGNITLDQPIQLELLTSILKLSLHHLPTDLGKLRSLRWTAETAGINNAGSLDLNTPGPIYNHTLNLTDATPDAQGNFTAYIAFLSDLISVCKGGSFSVTLTAENGTTYMASTTSAQGKEYNMGKRYTASMGNTGAGEPEWKRVVTASGLQELDPNVFNATVPTWVITGGGTPEDDAKVCTNVKAALDALKAQGQGTNIIELTMTGVKTLPTDAFYECTALKTISLPQATSIGENAFWGCTALTTLSLPAAKGIGEYAFAACNALTTLSLPAATTIGQQAFFGCFALTRLELTAAGSITLHAAAFGDFITSPDCTLVLHADKRPGGTGKPNASADRKWGATGKEVQWKAIEYLGTALPPITDDNDPWGRTDATPAPNRNK